MSEENQSLPPDPFVPVYDLLHGKPAIVRQNNGLDHAAFIERPLFGALIFDNVGSDARDHCANERTFLSWLRLAVYMAIVSVAIVLSFHLNIQPSEIEKRLAFPVGMIFWLLSVACLGSGIANYIITVNKYGRREALVQSGWKTQLLFTFVAATIIASCVLFLFTRAHAKQQMTAISQLIT